MYYLMYKDNVGDWRWNFKSSNGRIIADSGEGYRNKADCLNGVKIMKGSNGFPVIE